MEVFGRSAEYDPKIDSAVRVEMGRLRSRLVEYYAQDGSNDPVRIEIPKGGYEAVFVLRHGNAAREQAGGATAAALPPRRRSSAATYLLALGIALAGVTGFLLWKRASTASNSPPASVAILPFLNLSGDSARQYMADSVTDELTEALAEVNALRVVARTSAFQFKGQGRDVREIGRRLNVANLVEGSLQLDGGNIALVVQLIRCGDGYHIWSHTYEGPVEELREMEGQIAAATSGALSGRTEKAPPVELQITSNFRAHDLYLRAAYLFHQGNITDLRQAVELCKQALALDPAFARAHLLMSKTVQNLAAAGAIPAREGWDRSLASMQKVAALAPDSSEVHTYFAHRAYVYEWNWSKAEQEFQRALRAPGSHGNAHNLYGWGLMTRKRFGEARDQFRAGLEIDPLVIGGSRQNLVVDWILERNGAQARQEAGEMLQLNPHSLAAFSFLGWEDLIERDCGRARADIASAGPMGGGWGLRNQALLDAVCGQPDQARLKLAKLSSTPELASQVSGYSLAEAYGLLGDNEHALPLLAQAADQRDSTIMYLELDPLFDSIRRDARFQALASRIGLPK